MPGQTVRDLVMRVLGINKIVIWLPILEVLCAALSGYFQLNSIDIVSPLAVLNAAVVIYGCVCLIKLREWLLLGLMLAQVFFVLLNILLFWKISAPSVIVSEVGYIIVTFVFYSVFAIFVSKEKYNSLSQKDAKRAHLLGAEKGILAIGFTITLVFIFSLVIDTGYFSYGSYAWGMSALFVGTNEISLIMMACAVFSLGVFLHKRRLVWLLPYIAFFSVDIIIGTTTSIFGTIIISIVVLFYSLLNDIRRGVISTSRVLFIVIFFILCVMAGIFLLDKYDKSQYMQDKYEVLINEGPRSSLRTSFGEYADNNAVSLLLTGQGRTEFLSEFSNYVEGKKNLHGVASPEMDLLGALGSYGILGAAIIYLSMLLVLIKSGTRIFGSTIYFSETTILLAIMGHSLLAGHVLFASFSMFYFGIVAAARYSRLE